MNPTKLAMLYRGIFEWFPQKVLEYTKYTPARAYRRAKNLNEMFEAIGRDLYKSNADEEKADRDGKRDVMSILSKCILAHLSDWSDASLCTTPSQGQRCRGPTLPSHRKGGLGADAPPHFCGTGDGVEHAQLDALRTQQAPRVPDAHTRGDPGGARHRERAP